MMPPATGCGGDSRSIGLETIQAAMTKSARPLTKAISTWKRSKP